jgi:hypothetical protein
VLLSLAATADPTAPQPSNPIPIGPILLDVVPLDVVPLDVVPLAFMPPPAVAEGPDPQKRRDPRWLPDAVAAGRIAPDVGTSAASQVAGRSAGQVPRASLDDGVIVGGGAGCVKKKY